MKSGEILAALLPVAGKLEGASKLFPDEYRLDIERGEVSHHRFNKESGAGVSWFGHPEVGVSFTPSDCFRVTGFNSGKILYPFMANWRYARGWEHVDWDIWDIDKWGYLDPHFLLWQVFNEELLTAVQVSGAEFSAEFLVVANANPVKGSYGGIAGVMRAGYPDVFICEERLAAIADKCFPERSEDWIRSFEGSSILLCEGSSNSGRRYADSLIGREVSELVAGALLGVEDVVGAQTLNLFLEIARGGTVSASGLSFVDAVWVVAGALAV